MKKKEFFDLLKYYLREMPSIVIDDIISDYEEHFAIALESGKTEQQICEELGSPEAIAKEYFENEKTKPSLRKANNTDNTTNQTNNNQNENTISQTNNSKGEKKNINIVLIIFAIIGVIVALPTIFGLGMGVVGIILGILGLIVGLIGGIFGLFVGLIATLIGGIIAIIGTGISLLFASFRLFISIFIPNISYYNYLPDFLLGSSALTKLFASIFMFGFGILTFIITFYIIKFILKLIKKMFIAIKWKINRRKEQKNEKIYTDNSDNNNN